MRPRDRSGDRAGGNPENNPQYQGLDPVVRPYDPEEGKADIDSDPLQGRPDRVHDVLYAGGLQPDDTEVEP